MAAANYPITMVRGVMEQTARAHTASATNSWRCRTMSKWAARPARECTSRILISMCVTTNRSRWLSWWHGRRRALSALKRASPTWIESATSAGDFHGLGAMLYFGPAHVVSAVDAANRVRRPIDRRRRADRAAAVADGDPADVVTEQAGHA